MHRILNRYAIGVLVVCSSLAVITSAQGHPDRFSQFWGARYSHPPPAEASALAALAEDPARQTEGPDPKLLDNRVYHWNKVAMDAVALDHTPPPAGDARVFGDQLGPARTSRALAIVHVAVYDAVNAIAHRYESFTGIPDVSSNASIEAAVAYAAHDTLVALFPSQRAHSQHVLAEDLAAIPDGPEKSLGAETGQRAARAILQRAAEDGSARPDPVIGVDFFPGDQPGDWRPDPVSGIDVALGAYWGQVRPLVIRNAPSYRVPPPPRLKTLEYAQAYEEAKRMGGDGVTTPTVRTDEQTQIGIYWGYDGTPQLGTPPRLYNQIAVTVAAEMGADLVDLARLLALVNVALSDTGIAAWESKYHWQLWRPVVAIREADPGTGPSGRGDGNALTAGDPAWTPLGAPASNLLGPDFTPPFPAYPSGHAAFGGALFQTLRNVYRTDGIPFTFVSDEFNGETQSHGVPRPWLSRTFSTLAQAEEENGQSRIYLGIHWSFDKTAGIAQGRQVADDVFRQAFRPRR